jgi:transmembrane sensor
MSPSENFGPLDERIRIEAADWFARMRGPDADLARAEFEAWYAASAHKRAYEQLVGRWEQSAFIGASRVGRERQLARVTFAARHPLLSAAAALVMLVGAGSLVVSEWRTRHKLVEASRATVPLRFETGSSIRDIALSDGSRVTMDRASLMLVSYSPAHRTIRLARGRARFHLVRDPERPFTVRAGAGEMIAQDTIFDVALEDRGALVRAVDGAVSVRSRLSATPRLVLARQQVVVPQDAPMTQPAAIPSGTTSWLPRMIALDHTSLGDAALQVGRDAPHQILFLDDASALQITGSFRSGDVDGLATAAQALFNLRRTHDSGGNILLSRTPKTPKK